MHACRAALSTLPEVPAEALRAVAAMQRGTDEGVAHLPPHDAVRAAVTSGAAAAAAARRQAIAERAVIPVPGGCCPPYVAIEAAVAAASNACEVLHPSTLTDGTLDRDGSTLGLLHGQLLRRLLFHLHERVPTADAELLLRLREASAAGAPRR